MRPKITDKDWDKIVQDAFSAGAPEPHFSGRYSARRQSMEEKLAMKEERRNAFQPGLVIATVCALLIAATPAVAIWRMNRPATKPGPDPGTVVLDTAEMTTVEADDFNSFDVTGTQTIPDLTGYRYEYAKKIMEQEGYQVDVEFLYSDSLDAGDVMRIEPAPGSVHPAGTTVTLYVSKGIQETFEMPDCIGMAPDQAKSLLEYYGMQVEITYTPTGKFAGTVRAQSVEPGTLLEPGSTVTLTVAETEGSDN